MVVSNADPSDVAVVWNSNQVESSALLSKNQTRQAKSMADHVV